MEDLGEKSLDPVSMVQRNLGNKLNWSVNIVSEYCSCVGSVQGAKENMLASHPFFTPAVLKNINETLCFYHIGLGSPITNLESFSPAPPPKKNWIFFLNVTDTNFL